MSARVQHHVAGRLSLSPPQTESLERLKQALDAAPQLLSHDERDVAAILATLKAKFPTGRFRARISLTMLCAGHRCRQDAIDGSFYRLPASGARHQ